MDALPDAALSALFGFIGGLALGLAARRGRFCTLGAIEDALYARDSRRLRMWALALAVAILGTFLLEATAELDLGQSLYAASLWNPLESVAGGLIFGYGMALAGNCGYGALARCGGGDLRSFVIVLVMGISAYMAIAGPTALLRRALFPEMPPAADLGQVALAHRLARHFEVAPLLPALLAALALAGWALSAPAFRKARSQLFWSLVVGLAIVWGWWSTSWLAAVSFEVLQVDSYRFTAPLGETILYMMTASGGGITFGVGAVAGVLTGACLGSLSKGHFRWEACDDPRELGRQVFGAFLMGTGGVIAMGCSVGQGLTAFAMLAWSGPVTLAAIALGAAIGLRQLIRGFSPAA